MNIILEKPLALNQKGPRQYNQDSLSPNRVLADESDRLFIVCDGVGGAKFGEVASRLACDALATYFAKHQPQVSDETFWRKAFKYTNERFDHWFVVHPEHRGMATTAVVLHLHDMGFTVAHCGDSRLCHFRDGHLLWKTTDHTPLNDQLRAGLISPEEAALLPRSSSISRAFQGEAANTAIPEVTLIESVEPGDYLLLCSDGVWGCFSDAELAEILFAAQPDKEKLETINLLCEANSTDNFTAWLIAVATVDGKARKVINAVAVPQADNSAVVAAPASQKPEDGEPDDATDAPSVAEAVLPAAGGDKNPATSDVEPVVADVSQPHPPAPVTPEDRPSPAGKDDSETHSTPSDQQKEPSEPLSALPANEPTPISATNPQAFASIMRRFLRL